MNIEYIIYHFWPCTNLILDAYNPISQLPEDIRDEVKKLEEEGFSYPANYTTVYYDAWINDSHVDPILSLIHATVDSNQSDYAVNRQRDIGNAAAAVAGVIELFRKHTKRNYRNYVTTVSKFRL